MARWHWSSKAVPECSGTELALGTREAKRTVTIPNHPGCVLSQSWHPQASLTILREIKSLLTTSVRNIHVAFTISESSHQNPFILSLMILVNLLLRGDALIIAFINLQHLIELLKGRFFVSHLRVWVPAITIHAPAEITGNYYESITRSTIDLNIHNSRRIMYAFAEALMYNAPVANRFIAHGVRRIRRCNITASENGLNTFLPYLAVQGML